ncbi:MAG: hypothetical protein IPM54_14270 [Polyangiaceae bacterium]|nr:hypothetical protein [Polyangiaceae bacterium]
MRMAKRNVLAMVIAPLLAGCGPEVPQVVETVAAVPQALTSDTTWMQAASMLSVRKTHATLALADGRVLIIGGTNKPEDAAEVFEIVTDSAAMTKTEKWTRIAVPDSFAANCRPGLAQLSNGTVLVFGMNSMTGDGTVWSFHPDSPNDPWSEIDTLSIAGGACDATIVSLDEDRALLLSTDSSSGQSFSFLYHSGKVDATPTMPVPSAGNWVGAAAIRLRDGIVLISGGGGSMPKNRESIIYDPGDPGAWIPSNNEMTFPRSNHVAALLPSGNVIVAGGFVESPHDGDWSDTAEVFDFATMTWAPTAPMLNPRRDHTATSLSTGSVLVVGGSDSSTAEVFDPLTKAMVIARKHQGCSIFPAWRYVASGWSRARDRRLASGCDESSGHMRRARACVGTTRSAHRIARRRFSFGHEAR